MSLAKNQEAVTVEIGIKGDRVTLHAGPMALLLPAELARKHAWSMLKFADVLDPAGAMEAAAKSGSPYR